MIYSWGKFVEQAREVCAWFINISKSWQPTYFSKDFYEQKVNNKEELKIKKFSV